MSIVLLLGGARAGKSDRAMAMARERAGRVLFVATAEALDAEMAHRILKHRQERPASWDLAEIPRNLAGELARFFKDAREPYGTVIVDCVTLWVSNILLAPGSEDNCEQKVVESVVEVLDVAALMPATQWIFVSNEVGLGIVPDNAIARRYRDALGRANQLVSAAAESVLLMVAGNTLRLK
jgi:adenosylcobinamide kinase / adenosylcobinamide-phosphate guanylyltransferase